MNYNDMKDFEINKLVAERLSYTYKQFKIFKPDYCNNPEDAWPIILGNKISIDFYALRQGPTAYTESANIQAAHENPLRASMIVYLMMGEV